MDRVAVRDLFRAFVGEVRFRRFVHVVNTRCKGRLFYWQQDLWDQFVVQNPDADTSFETLQENLRFCEVHGCDLTKDAAPFDWAKAIQYRARIPLPYPYLVTGGRDFRDNDDSAEVSYCPECRRLADEWIQLPRAERSDKLKKRMQS